MYKYFTGAVLCLSVACGGDEGGGDYRPPPSEAELCSLSIGVSTPDDALAVLGPTSSTTVNGEVTLLYYEYGDPAALRAEFVGSLMLIMTDGRFDEATAINVPYPQCWATQSAARDAAREADDLSDD